MNIYEHSSAKGEKNNQTLHVFVTWRRDSTRPAELWANTEQRSGASSSPGFVSEFNSRFVRQRDSCCPWQQDTLLFFSNKWHNDSLKHSTLNLFPLGRSLLQLRVFSVGFCFSVFQGCWQFSFFKLSILSAIVYRGFKKKWHNVLQCSPPTGNLCVLCVFLRQCFCGSNCIVLIRIIVSYSWTIGHTPS